MSQPRLMDRHEGGVVHVPAQVDAADFSAKGAGYASGHEDDIRALNRRTIEQLSCDVERVPIGKRTGRVQISGTEVQHKVV